MGGNGGRGGNVKQGFCDNSANWRKWRRKRRKRKAKNSQISPSVQSVRGKFVNFFNFIMAVGGENSLFLVGNEDTACRVPTVIHRNLIVEQKFFIVKHEICYKSKLTGSHKSVFDL
jgi:hypothetical protein